MSVSVSVSASWNASYTIHDDSRKLEFHGTVTDTDTDTNIRDAPIV